MQAYSRNNAGAGQAGHSQVHVTDTHDACWKCGCNIHQGKAVKTSTWDSIGDLSAIAITQVLCLGIRTEGNEHAMELLTQTSNALSNAVTDEEHASAVYITNLSIQIKQVQMLLTSPASRHEAAGFGGPGDTSVLEDWEAMATSATNVSPPAGNLNQTPAVCTQPEISPPNSISTADSEVGKSGLDWSISWEALCEQNAADWMSSQLDSLFTMPDGQFPGLE